MNRNRAFGFAVLLAIALLLFWCGLSGSGIIGNRRGLADLLAAIFAPADLEEVS